MSGEMRECPLCHRGAQIATASDHAIVQCGLCGSFQIDIGLIPHLTAREPSALRALSAAVRQASEAGQSLLLDSAHVDEHITVHKDRPLSEKLNRILVIARQRSEHFGAQLMLQPEDEYLLFDAAGPVEAWALVQQLQEARLLTNDTTEQVYFGSLTRKGWEAADRLYVSAEMRTSEMRAPVAPSMSAHTFAIAFSFPGDARYRIEPISTLLKDQLGPDRVFYDNWYKAHLARPNLDIILQKIYTAADLVVVCLCADYERKEWCGIEWRAIRDLIKRREDKVMFLRTDDTTVSGVFSIDGYIDLRTHNDSSVATLILERVKADDCGSATQRPQPRQPPIGVPIALTPDSSGEEIAPQDLIIDVYEIAHGLGARVRNEGRDPVKKCQLVMDRLDRYLPQKQEFTRNPFESMTILFEHQINGGESSAGFAFATCDTSYRSIGFQAGVPEHRQSPWPEFTTEHIWIAEFTLKQGDRAINRQVAFIRFALGQKPALVPDPRAHRPTPSPAQPSRFQHLKNVHIRLTPVLPIARALDIYFVREVTEEFLEVEKSSGHVFAVPVSRIAADIPLPNESEAGRLLELEGRVQWLSLKREWQFLPQKPTFPEEREHGFFRAAAADDPIIRQLEGRGQTVRFARPENLPRYEQEGYQIVYDNAGLFLRRGDLVLIATGL
jgi:hypothetical protein